MVLTGIVIGTYVLSSISVLAYLYFYADEVGGGRVIVTAAAFVPLLNTVLAFLCLRLTIEEWNWRD